jgi:hypothetical protein
LKKNGRDLKEEEQMSTLKLRNIVVATIIASGGLFVSENMTTSPSQSLVTQAEARIGGPGTVVSLDMAYRSFREVLPGSTPASIRRLQSNVVTQIPA